MLFKISYATLFSFLDDARFIIQYIECSRINFAKGVSHHMREFPRKLALPFLSHSLSHSQSLTHSLSISVKLPHPGTDLSNTFTQHVNINFGIAAKESIGIGSNPSILRSTAKIIPNTQHFEYWGSLIGSKLNLTITYYSRVKIFYVFSVTL